MQQAMTQHTSTATLVVVTCQRRYQIWDLTFGSRRVLLEHQERVGRCRNEGSRAVGHKVSQQVTALAISLKDPFAEAAFFVLLL